ncbi:MAG: DNA-3-methyladenine glycosylase [Candidatus Kapaibacterium sp.]
MLSRDFFLRDSLALARDLLGCILETRIAGSYTSGRIVEVEAYRQEEPASHCYRGKTERNKAMFLNGGRLYVYFIYGMHHCVNIVAGREGYGEAVLLRGIEPVEGIEVMRERRGTKVRDRDLANGPGKLTRALGIGPEHNGLDLLTPHSPIKLLQGEPVPNRMVETTPRVGISKAVELPWRWIIRKDLD